MEQALGLDDDGATTAKPTAEENEVQQEEMEKELERISKEHDEERRRLEVTLQVEKARQKQELQRRKEKRRREKIKKKMKKMEQEQEQQQTGDKAEPLTTTAVDETNEGVAAPPKPVELGPKIAPLVPRVRPDLPAIPGGKQKQELAALLTKADALRRKEPLGSTGNKSTLNATSLRFLTEKAMARKSAWADETPSSIEISPPEAVEEAPLF